MQAALKVFCTKHKMDCHVNFDEGMDNVINEHNQLICIDDNMRIDENECLSFATNCGALNSSLNHVHICGQLNN